MKLRLAGDGPDAGRGVLVGEVAADEGETAVLADRFAFAEAQRREPQLRMWRWVMAQVICAVC
jgi:hypothetical protein